MLTLTLDRATFSNLFDEYNRSDNFSHQGRDHLFDYLDGLSDDMGEPLNIDVIGLCCEYREASVHDVISEHPYNDALDYAHFVKNEMGDDREDYKDYLLDLAKECLQDNAIIIAEYELDDVDYLLYQGY